MCMVPSSRQSCCESWLGSSDKCIVMRSRLPTFRPCKLTCAVNLQAGWNHLHSQCSHKLWWHGACVQVCLRSSPIYPIGSVGFTVMCDGIPKVGQLMKAAWSLTDTCRFKIKMPAVRLVCSVLRIQSLYILRRMFSEKSCIGLHGEVGLQLTSELFTVGGEI